ncbi:hypothetical protein CC85DRAFT_302400 [Cutaneotrichosporon oleaginosum]|uniref:Protein YAE1 n=1 Tax=Cutaneotrichosporon oleaginosum TaxID=879819 RepID=A0A0J1B400_9TREE|nr:uncharacterized protein CC85DRAFT_302400 [Cutaneotrichosporon oleaginosum]KLT42369.1 hypothetical protein CC85DRAFT_302400 [Cutaneotrichosporon oleaginosum]TXT04189.1 hypothetical protein COLE_07886 [Cutaneotrichosporon oleaginosum]
MDTDWDDDFAAAPQQGGAADPLVDTEYARLQQRYTDAGYREGIGEGKLSTLQAGFDEGFAASVPPARRIGQLRGRANALLAIALSPSPSPSSPLSEAELDALRALVSDLAAVRRDDVLPPDAERIAHEAEHGEDEPFEYDRTDARDMEGLEGALAGLGKRSDAGRLREDALLDALERRVDEAEARIL